MSLLFTMYFHFSCACALPLQPLLLLQDLSMPSFHSASITVIKEVIEEEKEEQNDVLRGLGPYGSCGGVANRRPTANNGNATILVNKSTNIYEHRPAAGKQSAKEEMQKARTNALQLYLRVLRTALLPQLPPQLGGKTGIELLTYLRGLVLHGSCEESTVQYSAVCCKRGGDTEGGQ
jgi:hypothetical protein